MGSSPTRLINEGFRKHITPLLKQSGFETPNVRKSYWRVSHAMCVLEIRALGAYLGFASGFPASSVCVWLGVYYPFFSPDDYNKSRIKADSRGMLVPMEVQCHLRDHLVAPIANPKQETLWNPAERQRRDVFWLEPDGSDADTVSRQIAELLSEFALPWFKKRAEPLTAICEIEADSTLNNKEFLCAHLALAAGRKDLSERYIQDAASKGFSIRMNDPDGQK